VTSFLANSAAASGGFDWSILATPAGVILGAAVTAFVALRSARKSVYERLESLLGIREQWPDGLAGRDTLDRSITFCLAEIRRKEKHTDGAVTTSEKRADRELNATARRQSRFAIIGSVAAAVVAALATLFTSSNSAAPAQQGSSGWASIAVTVATLVISAVVALIAFRRR
jgi:hypothetical protein